MDLKKISEETWSALNVLLDQVIELPAEQRGAFVKALPETRSGLKQKLMALLAHENLIDGDIDTPSLAVPQPHPHPQEHVGRYRLIRPIGEGGMGSVWLAERTDGMLQRPIALKLPRRTFNHSALFERLAREREILATLDHPNIAKVYDAGISQHGQPFLALEYIEGQTLKEHLQAHPKGVDAILELFLRVSDAVAYAHARLIIHRDLKPSNILISSEGQVKLLDFGIAKMLRGERAEQTELTKEHGQALTLAYASPEQVEAAPLSVATDIYSLGVLLFEMLTKTRPFEALSANRRTFEEAILKRAPRRPSEVASDTSLRRTLRGDLDTIILKALKKAPEERYATVAAFAEDLERYRSGHPVQARPDTAAYRLGKFIRRHKTGVTIAIAIVTMVLVGTNVTVTQTLEARRQRDIARYEQRRVQATNEFFGLLLDDVGAKRRLTPVEMLDRGVRLLERQHGTERRFIGRMYFEIAHRFADLGEYKRSLQMEVRAEEVARRQNDTSLLAATLCSAAHNARWRSDPEAFKARVQEGVALLQTVASPPLDDRVNCSMAQAFVAAVSGETGRSIELLQTARVAIESAPAASARLHAIVLNALGQVHHLRSEHQQALELNQAVLELHKRAGRDSSLGHLQVKDNRAGMLRALGEFAEEAKLRREVLEQLRESEIQGAQMHVQMSIRYAACLIELARYEEATQVAVEAHKRAAEAGRPHDAAVARIHLGVLHVRQGRLDKARGHLLAAEAGLDRNDRQYTRFSRHIERARVELLMREGALEEAWARVKALLEKVQYPEVQVPSLVIAPLTLALRVASEREDTRAMNQLSIALLKITQGAARAPEQSAHVGRAYWFRAKALSGQKARVELARAAEALERGLGAEHPEVLQARSELKR